MVSRAASVIKCADGLKIFNFHGSQTSGVQEPITCTPLYPNQSPKPGYFMGKPAKPWQTLVAQASQPAVSVSKPACRVVSTTHSNVFAPLFSQGFSRLFPKTQPLHPFTATNHQRKHVRPAA
jgi:hypothetical protein